MFSPRRVIIRSSAFLLALMMCGVASATGLTVGAVHVDGPVGTEASLELLDMRGSNYVQLEGSAESVYGQHFERRNYRVAPNLDPVPNPGAVTDPATCTPSEVAASGEVDCGVRTDIASADSPALGTTLLGGVHAGSNEYFVRAYPHAGLLSVAGEMRTFTATAESHVVASGGRAPDLPRASGEDERDLGSQEPSDRLDLFATRVVDGRSLLTDAGLPGGRLTLTGNFVLEIHGVDLRIQYEGQTSAYATGMDRTGAAAEHETYRFMRLYVEGGSITIGTQSFGASQDSIPGLQPSSNRPAALTLVASAQAVQSREHDMVFFERPTYLFDDAIVGGVLATPFALTLEPATNGGIGVDEQTPTPASASLMSVVDGSDVAWWIGGGAFFVAIAMVVFQRLRVPSLAIIEEALAAGSYRKAVRLSSRVLSNEPKQESAQLSRAIAWNRMGKHGRIVKALEPLLKRHDPSDGTLHYVLGLAQHDLGRTEDARAAMAEAVDRTPSLLSDIDPSLRITRASHNDAQAYT